MTISIEKYPSQHAVSVAPMNRKGLQWLLKPAVFIVLSLPFAWLVFAVFTSSLGANPIEAITKFTGEWSLRILLLSLCMTPLRMMLKKPWPIRLRRMVGLFAFFYVITHLLTYLLLDQQFDVAAIVADLFKRPYIAAGTVAFLLLVPLAITSNNRIMRRMGNSWQALHRLVYVAATAAVVHYVWLARGDQIEPMVYLFVLFVLMLFRVKKLVS